MEENNNQKQRKLFIAGLVALLVMVIGATYAYFAVTTVSNFGTSIINATAGPIGSVTLDGTNAELNLSVTALDMSWGNTNTTYYASPSGKTTTPTTVTIGTASVTPLGDTNTYYCTYTLSVTHSGTNDMYNVYTGNMLQKNFGQVVLAINGIEYDFYYGWPTNNQVTDSFYIKGNQTKDITASFRIQNDIRNQSYLADTDIQISISVVANSFSCTAIDAATLALQTDAGTSGLSTGDIVRASKTGIDDQDFYVVSTDVNKTVLLAKYNLLVGNVYDNDTVNMEYVFNKSMNSNNTEGYGLQSSTAKGLSGVGTQIVGVVPFSSESYWDDGAGHLKNPYNANGAEYRMSPYPNVYNRRLSNIAPSIINDVVQNNGYTIAYFVEEYFNTLGLDGERRLLTYEEAITLGCNAGEGCISGSNPAPTWVYSSSYWLGSTNDAGDVWSIDSYGYLYHVMLDDCFEIGVRPVIVVDTSDIASS